MTARDDGRPHIEPRRLSIAILVPRFHTNLYYAVRALVDAGHEVHLICRDDKGIEDHSIIRPIYPDRPVSFSSAFALLRRLAPDLLIIRDTAGLSRHFFAASMLCGYRPIGYDQNPHYRRRSVRKMLSGFLRGRPVRRITPVLGLDRSGPPDRFSSYVPFPVERPTGGVREYVPGGVVRILCVGKLSQKRKNQLLLVEALAPLRQTGHFTLTLVGSSRLDVDQGSEAYRDALMSHARSGPLSGKISILADVAFRDMPAIYASHDVCVLPSESEPLGTAPLEAMSYGCVPVISMDCGSAGYIDGKDCGFIVKAGDVESLARVLKPLIENPERIARLGQRARVVIEEEFSGVGFVEKIEKLANANPR